LDRYFYSYFHVFDAFIIIFGFTLDLILKGGTIEEAASLIIVLRLWYVYPQTEIITKQTGVYSRSLKN
jgi:hypothetical protein